MKRRLALMSAAAVAIAIAVVATLAWLATSRVMHAQIDRALDAGSLSRRLPAVVGPETVCVLIERGTQFTQGGVGSIQLVRPDGSVCAADPDSHIAQRLAGGAIQDAETTDGLHVRAASVPLAEGYTLVAWRDLTELDNTLNTLAVALLVVGGLGALAALTAGWVVAWAGLRPLDHLTMAAEHVAATQDLNVPIAVSGSDEVARLGGAFNKMTSALEAARQSRQQLIADAGHELRTPLTSLRTNIELLVRSESEGRELPEQDRHDLLRSLSAQVQELTQLTGELSLLTHDEQPLEVVPVRLDEVVRRAVGRASRRGRHVITTDLQPWTLAGRPSALERAVLNLLDNAIKFAPPGSAVTVTLRDGVVSVADEGPGIPEYERPQVFQRFWRSPAARAMPGSGLGLAIVADVATAHGGHVDVGASPAGGSTFSIRLPGSPVQLLSS
jgi:two-component system, OmpR family, sensor histidine kinase MprB